MFWGAAGYAGSVPRKVFHPGILVCLLVERLISLGASLGVFFLTVLLGACPLTPRVHERVHGGLRPVALLFCLRGLCGDRPGCGAGAGRVC